MDEGRRRGQEGSLSASKKERKGIKRGGNIGEREGGAMGQLCCFPFSQAEEKISKLSPALVQARVCVCVVGESSGIDLLAGGVCSRGRQSARARSSACRFVSASVIVCDLQTQAESQSAAVHFSVLSCKMNIAVYQSPEYHPEPPSL